MSNTTLTASVIAKVAVRILENELVMGSRVYRGYEDEFEKKVNGYEIGDTVTIRKPNQFTTRSTITASAQDVTEGKTSLTVDQIRGVDFSFTSQQLTQSISQLSERVIKPAMVQLANSVDISLHGLYKDVWNWVGTPGQDINAFADFAKGPERLDLGAVPQDDRSAVLSPTDHWAIAGSQTGLFMQQMASSAYREGSIGRIGGVDTYMSQNVQTHTVGTKAGTPLVNGAAQNVTYASVKDTGSIPGTQSLITDGWTASSAILKQGDVFNIAGVYAVNPVTKATLPHLQQFVVLADATADGLGNATLSIAPAMITSGAFQSVSAAPADNAAITVLGTASTGYAQNMVFQKNAFAFVSVPLVKPPGAVDVGRESYKGLNVRVIPYYDGTNDVSNWRMDVLFGRKAIDPRLATRISGT